MVYIGTGTRYNGNMKKKIITDCGFKAPFKASDLWVVDVRGRNVCETTHELAPIIAETLNQVVQITNL